MLDTPYTRLDKSAFDIDWICVKASQFSFSHLQKATPVLGVDMPFTNEVGCAGCDFSKILLSTMISTGFKMLCKVNRANLNGDKHRVKRTTSTVRQNSKKGRLLPRHQPLRHAKTHHVLRR